MLIRLEVDTLKTNVLFIEGNIGAGKSYLIENFKINEGNTFNFDHYEEPIDVLDNSLLFPLSNQQIKLFDAMYREDCFTELSSLGFLIQEMMLKRRLFALKNIFQSKSPTDERIIVMERSPISCHYIFGKQMHKQGKINSCSMEQMEKYLFSELEAMSSTADFYFYYLDKSVDICTRQIKQRCREGEENISTSFLHQVGSMHDELFKFNTTIPGRFHHLRNSIIKYQPFGAHQ